MVAHEPLALKTQMLRCPHSFGDSSFFITLQFFQCFLINHPDFNEGTFIIYVFFSHKGYLGTEYPF
jgi:hypothetical protein